MNPEVLQDLYDRAVSLGYKKSKDDFSTLLQTNQSVFDDNFSYVQSKGYKKSADEFGILVGKKKSTTAGAANLTPTGGVSGTGLEPSQDKVVGTVTKQELAKINEFLKTGVPTGKPRAKAEAPKGVEVDLTKNIIEVKPSKEEEYIQKSPKAYEEDTFDILANAFQRGLNQADLAANLTAVGGDPNQNMIAEIAKIQQENRNLKTSEAYQKFNSAESFSDAVGVLTESPGNFLTVLTELSLESLTAMAKHGIVRIAAGAGTGAAVGTAILGPAGTAAGAGYGIITGLGLTSLNLEYSGKMMEVFTDMGVDTTNPKQLESVFSDDKKVAEARDLALKKGIPIAIFDAISGGIAGRISSKPAKTLARKAILGGAELGTQMALGAGGEFVGQKVAGERTNWSAILGEALAEGFMAPVEVVGGATYRKIVNAPTNKEAVSRTVGMLPDNVDKANVIKDQVGLQLVTGDIDQTQAEEIVTAANKAIETEKLVPGDMGKDIRSEALPILVDKYDVLSQIAELEAQKETTDPAFHKALDARIEPLRKRVSEYDSAIENITTPKPAPPVAVEAKPITYDQLSEDAKALLEQDMVDIDAEIAASQEQGIEPDFTQRGLLLNNPVAYLENKVQQKANTQDQETLTKIKQEQDAIQKQTAGQVPVQPEARVGEQMEEGKPQAEPQAPAQEGQEVESAANRNIRESIKEARKMFGVSEAVKNVSNLFLNSGIRVKVIESADEFATIAGTDNAQGVFRSEEGVIYLNPTKFEEGLGRLVVYHEGVHPIINIVRNTDTKLYNSVRDGLLKMARTNDAVAESFRWTEANSINKDPQSIEDEQIVETLARIADGKISLDSIPRTLLDSIIEFFNTIALSMGLGRPFRQGDLKSAASIARQITKALKSGKGLEGIVGKGNVKEFQSNFLNEQLSLMNINREQFLDMTGQIASDIESMVVPGNLTNGWIQTGTKDNKPIVKFTGEATLENIRKNAIESYINRAYNLAQYSLSGIDVKGDFMKKFEGLDAKTQKLFEKSFLFIAKKEMKKILDSTKLNAKEKDTKEIIDAKKRTEKALQKLVRSAKDIGLLYDSLVEIGNDMETVSTSLITSLYQKRDFIYNDSVKQRIAKWKDQGKRGIWEPEWVENKIAETVFAKRDRETMTNESESIYNDMKQKVKDNLKFIYDLVNPAIRNLTKLWYDGANLIAQDFGQQYGLTLEQASGIIASQSPQMPWFSNLHLAQVIMDIMRNKGGDVFTKEQYDYFVSTAKGYAKQRAYIPVVKSLIGKRLDELSDYDAGIFIRSYYDLNMSRKAPKRLPSGVIVSYETNESSFSSYDTIEKGVSIFRNGSVENISDNLGEANKVRNFYNNIVDPTNINAVTIDTHAMAVSLIMPFGASDTEIKFDAASYAFYSDSYNELARELGIGARELQSITWEAIRAFFPDNLKTAKFKEEIGNIWKRYSIGEISIDQARNEILNKGQDANKTEWSDSIQDWMDGKTGTEYFRPIDRKGDVPGTATARGGQRVGGGVSAMAGRDIRQGRGVLGRKPGVEGQPSPAAARSTRVASAPFFNTIITDVGQAEVLRKSKGYTDYLDMLNNVANEMGYDVEIYEQIGGYVNDSGEKVVEISTLVDLKGATMEDAVDYASLVGVLAPEIQESTIALKYVNKGSKDQTANEYFMTIDDVNGTLDALKVAGIDNFSLNETEKTISFIDVMDFRDLTLEEKIGTFVQELDKNNISHGKLKHRPINSVFVGDQVRSGNIKGLRAKWSGRKQGGKNLGDIIEQAVRRDGNRRGRISRGKYSALKGAPSVREINGPDPRLVDVAEQYARDNGIKLRRQAEYVTIDKGFSTELGTAYGDMKHDPRNPKVKESYKDLIRQTIAQYQALVDAGYRFWFIDMNIPENAEYASTPYNALRDLRKNMEMGVFPTTDGFGSSDLDVNDNPLLAETGIMWPVGSLDGKLKPALANDIFRAVHDAFGHGLEGAGFRARGEENAWQAHVRLFYGPAVGAMTSETRGQNSWLNFGPYGDKNRTAKVKDTVFADQKTGLMPEWTWTERIAPSEDQFSPAAPRTIEDVAKALEGVDVTNASRYLNIEQTLPISLIDEMPRGKTFQEKLAPEYYNRLKNDIKENGVKEPIILKYYVKDNAIRLFEGHHRLKIARELGIQNVPIKVNVVWGSSIKEGNEDIVGQKIYNPPTEINIEKYSKRNYAPSNISLEELGFKNNEIAEAYVQAKQDGSNPELVKAVEDAIGEPTVATEVKEMGETFTVSKAQVADVAKRLEGVEKSKGKNLINGLLNTFTGKDYFYHGTTKPFYEFKKFKKMGVEEIETEQPIFLAQNKDAAEPFSMAKGGRLLRVKISKDAKLFDPDKIKTNEKPIEYDYSNLTDEAKKLAEAFDNNEIELTLGKLKDKDGYEIITKYIQHGDWDVLESKGVKEWLIKNGYDGVFIREFRNTKDKNLAIFNVDKLIINEPQSIASAYIQAKQDGSNPELVKAVEEVIGTAQLSPATPRGIMDVDIDTERAVKKAKGKTPKTWQDVDKAISDGDRVFGKYQMDDQLFEISNIDAALWFDLDDVLIVPGDDINADVTMPEGTKERLDKLERRAGMKGQPSPWAARVLMDVEKESQNYPYYEQLVNDAMVAYDMGVRNHVHFSKVIGRQPSVYMERAWEDAMNIKRGKKPLIQNQSDFKKYLTRLNRSELNTQERLKNLMRGRTVRLSERLFDSKEEFFKALAELGGDAASVISAYTTVIGGQSAKADYAANVFMAGTFDNLGEKQIYEINGQKYSELELYKEMLILFRVGEIQRKMEDKFKEFVSLDNQYKANPDPALKEKRDQIKDYLDRNKMLIKTPQGWEMGKYKYTRGLDPIEASSKLAQIQNAHPEVYTKLVIRVDAYMEAFNTLLEKQVENGLISQESFDELKKYKYVPMQNVAYMLEDVVLGDELKIGKDNSEMIKRLKGGSEEDVNMNFDEILKFATFMTYRRIAQNNAAKKLYEAARDNVDNKAFYIPQANEFDKYGNETGWDYDSKKEGLIYAFFDGRRVAIATDRFIANAYNGTNKLFKDVPDWLGIAFLTTPFRAITTNLNPGFGLAQIIIDMPQAILATDAYSSVLRGTGGILFRDLKLIGGVIRGKLAKKLGINVNTEWDELYQEAIQYGALISFSKGANVKEGFQNKNIVTRTIDRLAETKAGKGLSAYASKVESVNTVMETVTRLAVYRKKRNTLINQYKKNNGGKEPTGQALDDIRTQAAATSLNMLNYNRGGSAVKPLNVLLAYLNVTFQVFYSNVENFKKNPWNYAFKATELVTYGTLATILAYMLLDDDDKDEYIDKYNRMSEYEKYGYWHIPNRYRDPKNPDTYFIRLKKPGILLPLINSAEVYAMHHVTKGRTIKPMDYVKERMYDDMKAAQPFQTGLFSSVPTLNAFLIYNANYDYYRKQQVVKGEETTRDYLEGIDDPDVGKFYKYISKMGVIDPITDEGLLSPARMDKAVKAAIGNYENNLTTSLPMYLFDAALLAASGDYAALEKQLPEAEEKDLVTKIWEGTGLPKRFLTNIPDVNPKYYEQKNELLKSKDALNRTLQKTVEQIIRENPSTEKRIEMIRNHWKNTEKYLNVYSIDDYERSLKNAIKIVENNNWFENNQPWYKTFVMTPDKELKILIYNIETEGKSYDQIKEIITPLFKKGFIPDEVDQYIAKDLRSKKSKK